MTWDIYALRGPGGARSIEQIPEGWSPPAIGTSEEVRDLLRAAVPEADVSDPVWVRVPGAGWTVEALLGKAPAVHDVTFYITDADGDAVDVVLRMARALKITAYDTETGLVLMPDARPPSVDDLPDDDEDEEKPPWWRFWRR